MFLRILKVDLNRWTHYKALADLNRQQQKFPYLYPYTYTILDWWTASEEKGVRK